MKVKYQATKNDDPSPVTNLFRILKEIDEGKSINREDFDWLEKRGYYSVLAMYYESFPGEIGIDHLPTAGSYWRKAKNPKRALEITDNIRPGNPKSYSVLLIMRGGAYRDLKNFIEAEKCGREAIKLTKNNYYPYNLLGAIYWQQGLPGKADSFFDKAIQLGSTIKERDNMIISAMKQASALEKKQVAEYLLKKDAEKYFWVKKYL